MIAISYCNLPDTKITLNDTNCPFNLANSKQNSAVSKITSVKNYYEILLIVTLMLII